MVLKIEFDVGKKEKHHVGYYFDKFNGSIKIKVDGKVVQTDKLSMGFNLKWHYKLDVGDDEKHHVEIHIRRPLFFAPMRQWDYNIYDNGELIKVVGKRFDKSKSKYFRMDPKHVKKKIKFQTGFNKWDLYKSHQLLMLSTFFHQFVLFFLLMLIIFIIGSPLFFIL